ncbi:MAG: hypothetical protein K0R54_82 [Clostridiaceae bacterium]|jgi:hypothetical protein|nr:hypothetical protein [Clostridiaceae bacterium]
MKKITILILILSFILCFGMVSYATGTTTDTYSTKSVNINAEVDEDSIADGGLPEVTIDQVEEWVDRKGFDLVGLAQTFAQPFAILVFIICGFLALFGLFGNSQLFARGIFGVIFVVIVYACILYAPELLDISMSWLKS